MERQKNIALTSVLILLFVNLFYASISIATKFTSQQERFSLLFFVGLGVIILMLGIYAIIWQQVLKHLPLSLAYMFKGTSLIFVMLLSALLFNEVITMTNIIGSCLIIGGIVLYAK